MSVVRFVNGEVSTSIIQGFTIQNGIGTKRGGASRYGGGVYCDASSPTIQHNRIKSNTARWGGGIYCAYSAPVIQYNTLTANSVTWPGDQEAVGGAMYGYFSAPKIKDNNITGNSAKECGGVYLFGQPSGLGLPSIVGNMITFNTATKVGSVRGSGVWYMMCHDSCGDLSGNTIRGNSQGAIYVDYGYPLITRNTIVRNSGKYAIWIEDCRQGELLIENNTIDSNLCPYAIGAKTCDGFVVTNNIISNNDNQNYAMRCECDEDTGVVTFNDFWGNSNDSVKCNIPGVGDYSWGTNFNGDSCDTFYNISQDPMFADTINYALVCSSACVEAGDLYDIPPDTSGCRVDMGAHEFFYPPCTTCTIIYGDVDSTGVVNTVDVVYFFNYLFKSGPAPRPLISGDVNWDQVVDIVDYIYLFNYIFKGGRMPCRQACP